jgi:hypothetical protein
VSQDANVLPVTLEHGDLLTQDQNLRVPGAPAPREQGEPAEHPEHRKTGEPQ